MGKQRWFSRAIVALLPVLVTPGAQAQVSAEILGASLNDWPSDTFACGDGTTPCGVWLRYWGDRAPLEINGPSSPIDGYPRYAPVAMRYKGDNHSTGSFPQASLSACEAWFTSWTGLHDPGLATFISYYGAQSQIVNVSESGSDNLVDCAASKGFACFGALDQTFAGPSSPGGPAGGLQPLSGLTPVPAPHVSHVSHENALQLRLPELAPANTINLPSASGVPCPPSAPFDDLTATSAPSPYWGIGLYMHVLPEAAPYRSLYDLEGVPSANGPDDLFQSEAADPGAQLACTGPADCPGVVPIPCNLTSAVCVSSPGSEDLFSISGAQFLLTQDLVASLLGVPLGFGETLVFNTKVFHRGSRPGSSANPASTAFNPSLVSAFSANSVKASFEALAARVTITRLSQQGGRVRIEFAALGQDFAAFTIQRADDGVSFFDRGVVEGTGAGTYVFVDVLRGRRPLQATYRILAQDFEGRLVQALATLELSNSATRGPRTRR